MSVKELIKQKTKKYERDRQLAERREKDKKRRDLKKIFDKEIEEFIWQFERRYFNINSSENDVAETIYHCNNKDDRNYVAGEHFRALDFEGDDKYRMKPTKSTRFNEWKKAIEDKFEIKLRFYEYQRNANAGMGGWPDYVYEGICVVFMVDD